MGMHFDTTTLRHPSRRQLVAFAESLVDRNAAVSAMIAAHVSACPRCAAEVKAIRASLAIAASAEPGEPSDSLAHQIIASAREARRRPVETHRPGRRLAGALTRGAGFMTATAAAALFVFHTALSTPSAPISPATTLSRPTTMPAVEPAAPAASQTLPVSPDQVRRRAGEIERLASIVSRLDGPPRTWQEWTQRRALDGVSEDLNAALAALERNPGCSRASELVQSRLASQVERLRDLFIEQTL